MRLQIRKAKYRILDPFCVYSAWRDSRRCLYLQLTPKLRCPGRHLPFATSMPRGCDSGTSIELTSNDNDAGDGDAQQGGTLTSCRSPHALPSEDMTCWRSRQLSVRSGGGAARYGAELKAGQALFGSVTPEAAARLLAAHKTACSERAALVLLCAAAFFIGRLLGVILGADTCMPLAIAHLYDISGGAFAIASLTALHVSAERRWLLRWIVAVEILCGLFAARALGFVVPPFGLPWRELTTQEPIKMSLTVLSCAVVIVLAALLLCCTHPQPSHRIEVAEGPDDCRRSTERFYGDDAPHGPLHLTRRRERWLRASLMLMATMTISTSKEIMCLSIYQRNSYLYAGASLEETWGESIGNWLASFRSDYEAAAYEGAIKLHAKQRPFFLRATRNFKLHPYFDPAPTEGLLSEWPDYLSGTHWYGMLGRRTGLMAARLRANGRDDFKIERDKCTMQNFMVRNGVPMVSVLGTWRINHTVPYPLDALVGTVAEYITSGRIFDDNPDAPQPFFLKCCHLTHGSVLSVRSFHRDDVTSSESQRDELRDWLMRMGMYKSDDFERPWRRTGNMISAFVGASNSNLFYTVVPVLAM